MPNTFIKYIQSTHYFELLKNNGHSIYPKASLLPKEIVDSLERDESFSCTIAKDYDLSFRAVQMGYIGETETYSNFKRIPLKDEYHFIRKYFHPIWASYILLMRLCSFKNPFKEIPAWFKTRNIKRSNYLETPIQYENWGDFKSSLIEENPMVTVVIPTLNRYGYLKEILQDFEKQTYTNFEIIIVDQSHPFQKDFCKNFSLNINHLHQKEPALWLARNTAIQHSNGDIIALSEDDVRIEPNWIENHLKCLDFFNAEISAGVFFPEGSSIPKERSFFRFASQFATGNAMLYKEVFKKIGLFDRQFEKQRMGDGEFGLRAYLNNIKSVSNPFAFCIDVKAPSGGLRQMGSWDAFRPKKWLSPRPIPSVLYLFRKYYGTKRTFLALLKTIPPSIIPYQFKKNKKLLLLGIIISIFLLPIILVQVSISWRKASKKLNQGALISELN